MGIFQNVGGNIPGGNFLGGNFPGGSLMAGNLPGGSISDTMNQLGQFNYSFIS